MLAALSCTVPTAHCARNGENASDSIHMASRCHVGRGPPLLCILNRALLDPAPRSPTIVPTLGTPMRHWANHASAHASLHLRSAETHALPSLVMLELKEKFLVGPRMADCRHDLRSPSLPTTPMVCIVRSLDQLFLLQASQRGCGFLKPLFLADEDAAIRQTGNTSPSTWMDPPSHHVIPDRSRCA